MSSATSPLLWAGILPKLRAAMPRLHGPTIEKVLTHLLAALQLIYYCLITTFYHSEKSAAPLFSRDRLTGSFCKVVDFRVVSLTLNYALLSCDPQGVLIMPTTLAHPVRGGEIIAR